MNVHTDHVSYPLLKKIPITIKLGCILDSLSNIQCYMEELKAKHLTA